MASDGSLRIEKLDDENYPKWRSQMRFLLTVKKVWAAIEPAVQASSAAKTDDTGVQTRSMTSSSTGQSAEESDLSAQALSIIGLNVEDHLLLEVAEAGSAREIWDHFETIFQAKTNANKLRWRQQLATLKKLPTESISQYLARARAIMTALKSAGSSLEESEVALAVLAGLPESYSVAVEVLQCSEDISFAIIMPRLLQVEQRIKEKLDKERASVQAYGANVQAMKVCFYCKEAGHIKRNCDKFKKDMAKRQVAF